MIVFELEDNGNIWQVRTNGSIYEIYLNDVPTGGKNPSKIFAIYEILQSANVFFVKNQLDYDELWENYLKIEKGTSSE